MTAYILNGSDASLVSKALTELLAELGDRAGGLTEIEEFQPVDEAGESDDTKGRFDIGPILTALSTPAWLSDRRIVVLRDSGALSAAQAAELSKLVAHPPTSNLLVLAAGGKPVPQVLSKAVKAAGGHIVDTDPGRNTRARNDWLNAHLTKASVHLDATARARIAAHLGEDAARLDPILELLAATYGPGSKISAAQLEPLLGQQGAAPPWELTDAIDAGDGERAVEVLQGLLQAGGRHPLQVLTTLHRHVSAMLRLDGAEAVRNADDVAALLGMSAFPAKKILEQARRLGHDRLVRAIEVVADADADIRGRVAWSGALVMEVAVARLAQLSRPTARPGSRSGVAARR
ncbi:MAG: DNA polymerase III subunit delta [Acidimicrobiales bacterium]